jgi:hypothetical protein
MRCLELEEWLELLSHGEAQPEALLHAAECHTCGRLSEEIGEMLGALDGLRVVTPPSAVMERAAGIVRRGSWIGAVVRELVGVLTADSSTLVPVPVRGSERMADSAARRYLRFEAGRCVAEIHAVRHEAGRYDVAGRLLEPKDQAPFVVLALGSSGFGYPRMSDESGHFHFADLPADHYQLRLELEATDLVLAPLALD